MIGCWRLNLAEVILHGGGELAGARPLWREIAAARAPVTASSARDLHAIARATRHLGKRSATCSRKRWAVRPGLARGPGAGRRRHRAGRTAARKIQQPEAQQIFREVLENDAEADPRALGLARKPAFRLFLEAVATTLARWRVNPNLVPARVFLARLFIELEQYEDARQRGRARAVVDPVSLEALSMLGAIAHCSSNGSRSLRPSEPRSWRSTRSMPNSGDAGRAGGAQPRLPPRPRISPAARSKSIRSPGAAGACSG